MEDIIYLNMLYDYYKDLLTDKQKSYFEDYYFDNLTMDEIAQNHDISRNAISKSLIETKEKLEEYERILHLVYNYNKISELVSDDVLNKIKDYI